MRTGSQTTWPLRTFSGTWFRERRRTFLYYYQA